MYTHKKYMIKSENGYTHSNIFAKTANLFSFSDTDIADRKGSVTYEERQ